MVSAFNLGETAEAIGEYGEHLLLGSYMYQAGLPHAHQI